MMKKQKKGMKMMNEMSDLFWLLSGRDRCKLCPDNPDYILECDGELTETEYNQMKDDCRKCQMEIDKTRVKYQTLQMKKTSEKE